MSKMMVGFQLEIQVKEGLKKMEFSMEGVSRPNASFYSTKSGAKTFYMTWLGEWLNLYRSLKNPSGICLRKCLMACRSFSVFHLQAGGDLYKDEKLHLFLTLPMGILENEDFVIPAKMFLIALGLC